MTKEFPCPVCRRIIIADAKPDGSAILQHRGQACNIAPGDLLRAYVQACDPDLVHSKIDGHELLKRGGIDFGGKN